eukprot:751065-Hanusia_phi.AAC.2
MGKLKTFPVTSRGHGVSFDRVCSQVDPLAMDKLKQSWLVASVFLLNIYTNVMALKSCNVETVIVFRSLTTVFIAVGDARVLQGKQGPNLSVLASLLAIVVCAVCYVRSESKDVIQPRSYFWLLAYMLAQTADCLYIKHNVNTVNMSSWGRSYYNNVLALGPLAIPWMLSEDENLEHLSQQVCSWTGRESEEEEGGEEEGEEEERKRGRARRGGERKWKEKVEENPTEERRKEDCSAGDADIG